MRIFIQNCLNRKYYKGNRRWTFDLSEAIEFGSYGFALDFCRRDRLRDVQIALRFDDPRYDSNLPVSPSCYEETWRIQVNEAL